MLILAFSKTTEALLAGCKTVTRREWGDVHFNRVLAKLKQAKESGKEGLELQAWSASPHRGGKRVGTILLTSLTRERTADIPDSDWEAEGFAYMAERGLNVGPDMSCQILWRAWRCHPDKETAVLRFRLTAVAA